MVQILHRILAARSTHETWTPCWTSATTCWAGPSAPWVTARQPGAVVRFKFFKQDYLDYIEGRRPPMLSPAELVGAH